MRSKALIIVLLITLLSILALCLTVAINDGIIIYFSEGTTIFDYFSTGQSILRTLTLLIFTLVYCKTWYYGESPGNAFADVFLLAATLVETRVFYLHTELTGQSYIPPVILARIQITSVILMLLSMISSALYYQNNEYSAVSLLKGVSVAVALTLGLLLPLPLSYKELFTISPSLWILIVLCLTAFESNLILMFTEPPGIGTFKQLASIIIINAVFVIFFFNLPYSDLVGSILLSFGYIADTILSARNSISLY